MPPNISDEGPEHTARVEAFHLGRYPVTRAEFARFVEAGGYEDAQWWTGEDAQLWFDGTSVGEGERQSWRDQRALLQSNRGWLDDPERFTPLGRKFWHERLAETDAAFEAWLDDVVRSGKQNQPDLWEDTRYDVGTYPVIGVCFFEAKAYLAWLSAQVGQCYRLPTEHEWERSARGLLPPVRSLIGQRRDSSLTFPWGHTLDPLKHANVYESHIRGLTPVGVYPDGRSAEGVAGALRQRLGMDSVPLDNQPQNDRRAGFVSKGDSGWVLDQLPCGLRVGRVGTGTPSTLGATISVSVCVFRPPSRNPEP